MVGLNALLQNILISQMENDAINKKANLVSRYNLYFSLKQ